MAVRFDPPAGFVAANSDNDSMAAGTLTFYYSGTTDPAPIFTDTSEDTPLSNPVTLDASGRPPVDIYVLAGTAYRVKWQDANGAELPGSPMDDVFGVSGAKPGGSVYFATTQEADLAIADDVLLPAENRVYPAGTMALIGGYAAEGDGGHYFAEVSDSSNVYNPNVGRMIPADSAITPAMFGEMTTDAKRTRSFQAWADAVSNTSHTGRIPAGNYNLDTTAEGSIDFLGSEIYVSAYRAYIREQGDGNGVVGIFNCNSGSDTVETSATIRNNFTWTGGHISCAIPAVSDGNDVSGFICRSITRGGFQDIFGTDLGGAMFKMSPRDAVHIDRCHGYLNGDHVHLDDYITNALGNPQSVKISRGGWSVHYRRGVYIESNANEIEIDHCYFIGSDAVVIETGGPYGGAGNTSIWLHHLQCEQATTWGTSGFYIDVKNTNAESLRHLEVSSCSFQDLDAKVLRAKNVDHLYFGQNRVVSNVDDFIDLDADCSKFVIGGGNEFLSFTTFSQGISYLCDRKEIEADHSTTTLAPIQLSGWNFSGRSTGTGTLDMSALVGSYWSSQQMNKLIPPRSWKLRVRVQDAGGGSIRFASSASEVTAYGAYVAAGSDETRQDIDVYCDDAGDIYYDIDASGSSTLLVQIMVLGYST